MPRLGRVFSLQKTPVGWIGVVQPSVLLRHSMKGIPIQPRNSTVRCKILYYSAYPALPFPMVGRISPQTPEPGTHQHCSETLRTAHYSLPTLFAARTKH